MKEDENKKDRRTERQLLILRTILAWPSLIGFVSNSRKRKMLLGAFRSCWAYLDIRRNVRWKRFFLRIYFYMIPYNGLLTYGSYPCGKDETKTKPTWAYWSDIRLLSIMRHMGFRQAFNRTDTGINIRLVSEWSANRVSDGDWPSFKMHF